MPIFRQIFLGRLGQRRATVAGEGPLAGNFEDTMADVPVFGEVRSGGVVGVDSAINGAALPKVGVELGAELAITAGARVAPLDLTVIGVHGFPEGWDPYAGG